MQTCECETVEQPSIIERLGAEREAIDAIVDYSIAASLSEGFDDAILPMIALEKRLRQAGLHLARMMRPDDVAMLRSIDRETRERLLRKLAAKA